MRRHQCKYGFTLIEMLVASVIGAFIAIVAVSSLKAVTSARGIVDDGIAVSDELRFATDIIRKDLSNLYRDSNVESIKFDSEVDDSSGIGMTSLTFYAVSTVKARPDQPESDIYEIQYQLVTEEEGSVLTRRVCPIVGNEEEDELTAGGVLTMIARNIVLFNARYFDGTDWTDEWSLETEGALPELIEVTLSATDEDTENKGNPLVRNFLVNFPRMSESEQQSSEQTAAEGNVQTTGNNELLQQTQN